LYDDVPVTALGESTTRTKGDLAVAPLAPCHEAKEKMKNDGVARKVTLEEGM
jgi:hypothetical protein